MSDIGKYFCIFSGYLKSESDLKRFIHMFNFICLTANKPVTKDTSRNLWHSLTGCKQARNIYNLPMPFFLKAVKASLAKDMVNKVTCNALIIPNTCMDIAGFPDDDYDNNVDMNKVVFFVSAVLGLQIRETVVDYTTKKTDIWLPPRDLQVLEQELVLPDTPCYVELYFHSMKFVRFDTDESNFISSKPKRSLFEYVLDNSPDAVRQVWVGFKETFLTD